MARKKQIVSEGIAPDLYPRDDEYKYYGPEPVFTDGGSKLELMKALSWYNRFYNSKDAKEFIIAYLDFSKREEDSRAFKKVSDSEIFGTYGWLARLFMRGYKPTEQDTVKFENELVRLFNTVKPVVKVVVDKPRVNIQEIMRDKTREATGELEGVFDQFMAEGCKAIHGLRPLDTLAEYNLLPQHIPNIIAVWERKKVEFELVSKGSDKQVNEAYSHLSKIQVRYTLRFIESVISDLTGYITVKKARKPQVRKAVPVEKIVSKMKVLKEYTDKGLNLVGLSAVKLHGACEAFLFDTKTRKLIYIVADPIIKNFSVKGTTVYGIDTVKSEMKTLRKVEVLKEFMKVGKPSSRKFFSEVTSVGSVPSGRVNDNMIILKAW